MELLWLKLGSGARLPAWASGLLPGYLLQRALGALRVLEQGQGMAAVVQSSTGAHTWFPERGDQVHSFSGSVSLKWGWY